MRTPLSFWKRALSRGLHSFLRRSMLERGCWDACPGQICEHNTTCGVLPVVRYVKHLKLIKLRVRLYNAPISHSLLNQPLYSCHTRTIYTTTALIQVITTNQTLHKIKHDHHSHKSRSPQPCHAHHTFICPRRPPPHDTCGRHTRHAHRRPLPQGRPTPPTETLLLTRASHTLQEEPQSHTFGGQVSCLEPRDFVCFGGQLIGQAGGAILFYFMHYYC